MLHIIETVEESTTDGVTQITRECTCGWVTIGTVPEPDFHTPLAEREAAHLVEAGKIEDQSIWNEVPAGHSYWLHLRRRLRDQTPNQVVITAVWTGGSQTVHIWRWDVQGLALAQRFCDERPNQVVWATSRFPVERGSLAVHAE